MAETRTPASIGKEKNSEPKFCGACGLPDASCKCASYAPTGVEGTMKVVEPSPEKKAFTVGEG